ncbi:uncharacterized protein PITG_10683 [Phytophthora infestans T30-4]|uniref:Transmembrane protein n=1 Tax=Phytophthora infestans (strain T30-4) TaxID=403677 RepID=D0NGV2_PHYIT|nr:uncharacterized protein PITG_10683 [Phytophthora infestans T30-4]EEY58591.1 conserved hypothetical protein [Phytophthora infestans T30-4]|eukprot:XP_002901535.1 conserved hypothetical protein [Phytophthora infestans T30-4]
MASSNSSGLEQEVTAPTNVSTSGDSCTWYAGESCEKSRTCYDCLNVGVVGDSCAVGVFGQCLSISEQIAGEVYYLASSSSYCDFSDEICTTCRSRWQEEYAAKGGDKSSTVCIGQNGCICLAVCERETRNSLVVHNRCPSFEKAKVGSIMLVIAMGVASFIIFSMFIFCIKKLLKRALPCTPPRGPQLSLSGWKSMRERLIETEKDNESSSAGASGVMRIQLSAREDTSSVIIEEGEGYRPGSPSEQYQTHRGEDISSEPFTLSQ